LDKGLALNGAVKGCGQHLVFLEAVNVIVPYVKRKEEEALAEAKRFEMKHMNVDWKETPASLSACVGNTSIVISENKKNLKGEVITLSGVGRNGAVDGPAPLAAFSFPSELTVDANRNVYVADYGNHLIRKISSEGAVTTIKGNCKFNGPSGIALKGDGSVYVADLFNNQIKVIKEGLVSTVAGVGNQGFANGPADKALFNRPSSIAFNSKGNLYVADQHNHRIRMITPEGLVSTVAGSGSEGCEDGVAHRASFYGPAGIAIDGEDNLFVADRHNHRIRKIISRTGTVITFAGYLQGFADGSGTNASFHNPSGLAVDTDGNLYVADLKNHAIRKISKEGEVTTIAGNGKSGYADGPHKQAMFHSPSSVAVDDKGCVYVADWCNHRIRKIV